MNHLSEALTIANNILYISRRAVEYVETEYLDDEALEGGESLYVHEVPIIHKMCEELIVVLEQMRDIA